MGKKILCVIAARGGSQGLKNKNIKNFCGKPLIAWSIIQAKKSKYIQNVHVSTDSLKIAKVSKKYGALVPFIRSKNLARKNSEKFLVWKDTLQRIEKNENIKFDYYLDLDCTNPLRKTKDINDILKFFFKIKNFDGIISISKSRKNPYFNMLEYNNSRALKPSKKLKTWPTSRQTAPKVFDQVASMYLLNANFLRKNASLYDGQITGFLLKEYQDFDIDSKLDFFIIGKLFRKYYLK